jgi:hypothetical protein
LKPGKKLTKKKVAPEKRERGKVGGSERNYIWGRRNYIAGFEGFQAVPTCPSGRCTAYDRN